MYNILIKEVEHHKHLGIVFTITAQHSETYGSGVTENEYLVKTGFGLNISDCFYKSYSET